jgi:hypothetical protein
MASTSLPPVTDGVAVQTLTAGTTVVVDTRHSEYRLLIIDGIRREIAIKGGTLFRQWTRARYSGASAGGCALRMGWLGVGLLMEIAVGEGTIVTSPVESIAIERHLEPASTPGIGSM